MHGSTQAGIGGWRGIQFLEKFGISLRGDLNDGAIQERFFRRETGGVEDELGAVLAGGLRGLVDEDTQFGLNAQIQGLAGGFLLLGDRHGVFPGQWKDSIT